MAESEWRKGCGEKELAEGGQKLVTAGEDPVLLTRLDGKIYAVGNKCTHYECKLNEGVLLGRTVICRCHDARFDLTTGKVISPPALNDLPVYPVKVEGGDVLLGPVQKARFPKVEGTDARTFLIIGGGAAGNAAAETLRRDGFAGRIVMITPEPDLPYDRPNLSKEFLSGEAKPEWMPLRSEKFYANQNIDVMLNARVKSLDPGKKSVTLEDGRQITYDKALLATGAVPRRLPIPGADGEACFQLRSFADARMIAEAAAGAKTAVLVGAGFIGMELASSLRQRGLSVEVAAPEPLPFARIVGERIASYLTSRHEEKGVVFHLGANITKVSGPRGAKEVELSNGTKIRGDFVVFGLGVSPAVEWLAGTGLVESGAVPVNARLQTKHPDVFAAGDIAVVPDPLGRGAQRIEHWVVAERQGQHAARAMLGAAAPYEHVPFFWTRQTGVSLKYVGLAREWDQVVYRGDVEKGKFLAGFYLKGTLLAAASIGMNDETTAVEIMLSRRLPLSADKLAASDVDLLALARG